MTKQKKEVDKEISIEDALKIVLKLDHIRPEFCYREFFDDLMIIQKMENLKKRRKKNKKTKKIAKKKEKVAY